MVHRGIKGRFRPSEILMYVGDSMGDFPIPAPLSGEAKEKRFESFGLRFFLIPNPVYGRWQGLPPR